MYTIEFADIRIRVALPLHPYLSKHPHLFLRIVADDSVCGDTAGVDGDLSSGVWEFNVRLYAPRVEQSLNVGVLTGVKGPGIPVVSVTLQVTELLARVMAHRNSHQDFDIFDSGTPIQLKLVMTCSIKISSILGRVSQVVGDKERTINRGSKNHESDFDPETMHLLSREDLESLYVSTSYMPDQDDSKARRLSLLGYEFHVHYVKGHGKEDLETAISIHEEAMQRTGLFHPHLVEHTHRFAMALLSRFKKGGDNIDIDRAVSYSQTTHRFTEDFSANKPALLSYRGKAFKIRFEHLEDLADINNSISCHRQVVELTPDGHPRKPERINYLGLALRSRFERLGSLSDMEDIIWNFRKAVKMTPDDHTDKPWWLSNLGAALLPRFERLGSLENLEDAISNFQKAIKLAPDGHSARLGLHNNLGAALQTRFERLGSLADLEIAISSKKKAVELTQDGHPDKPGCLRNLGSALRTRYERLGSLADLEEAISNNRMAVELTQGGHSGDATLFNGLGATLQARFERLGSLTDMDEAISNFQKVMELTPDGHPDKSVWFNNLGGALYTRFERLGSLADLEDAISNLRQAVLLTPDIHLYMPSLLNNIGLALQSRFERLGGLTDLEDAISNLRQAVQLMPDGHTNKPRGLRGLGSALQSRFERLGVLVDLEDAISNLRQVVQLTPGGHPDEPREFNHLGVALLSRFERLGVLVDLEDGISNLRHAVRLSPDDHPDKPRRLCELGNALQSRFEHLSSLTDLRDAISNQLKAVKLTPDDNPQKPSLLGSLGNALGLRFKRLGSIADLEDAISNQRRAIKLTPNGHPGSATLFTNLGNALGSRFKRLGSITDLEDAISSKRRAIKLTPNGHPGSAALFNNLGNALRLRLERLGSVTDLEDAISNYRTAVELTLDGHPSKPGWLYNLGYVLLVRFELFSSLSDLESGLSAFSAAANSPSGPPMERFKAAHSWAKATEKYSRSPLDAFSCAIDLLPRIAWLGLAVTDQHALLADVGGIVRDAVAAAIRYEEYETAVVWAEQGRTIVWQNLLGLRNPLDDLREAYPELANQLRSIATELEGSGSHEALGEKGKIASVEDVSHKHSKLALQWENLIDEIRRIPKFEGFLRAKRFSQLAPAAHEGPIVILKVSDSQCDALVLITDDSADRHVSAVSIPLQRFSHEKSKKMFQSLTELLSSAGVRERNDRKTGRAHSRADSDAKFKVILRVLWQDVVKPVIEGLAFQTGSNRSPRIWWCATGLLAFLPIHAAGLYDTQEVGEKVSDYVVSSYTPTLNAILELSDPVVREDFQVLTVAQASAPGAPPIPKTEDEIKIVQSLTASVRVLNMTGENATVEQVRDGMMQSNWIHLACHGKQNPTDPMRSGFLLHDRTLELSEIVKMSLPKADFAFLSACQTAMGDEKVAEESVHLAAEMFLSGCRGVIATTWSIRDDDAPKIAQEVYSRMFKDRKPNRKEAAYALHEAVKLLRESGAPCTAWVPFIHIGR